MTGVNKRAFGGLLVLVLAIAALLFIPAGTLDYWQAWTFLGVYSTASLAITLYLMKNDPKLLERRMRGGPAAEKEPTQKVIMLFASAGFIGLLIIPALDNRFGWSHMPPAVALVGDGLLALGWLATFFRLQGKQLHLCHHRTGPGPESHLDRALRAGAAPDVCRRAGHAGRHTALGSWWGLLALVATMPALVWRLLDEEKFLARNLPGYVEYQEKVRYRLIPHVW